MKKIAYIATAFPVLSETFIGNEIRALQRLNHTIELATFDARNEEGQQEDKELSKHAVELKSIEWQEALKMLTTSGFGLQNAMQFVSKQSGLPKRSLLWYGAKLAAFVKKSECQHIHAHFGLASTATAIVAARLTNLPVSFTCHGYDIYKNPSDLPLKLSNATFAVAVCDMMKNDMEALAPSSNIVKVRCGVDVSSAKNINEPNYRAKRLLYIGRLSETKGLFVMLQALASIPKAHRPQIDLVGDGPLKEELQTTSRILNVDNCVRFLGAKQSNWIAENHHQYCGLIAPFIVTPAGAQDTGPLVIKEAMMLKLPIITSDIRACLEMLNNQPDNNALANIVKSGCSLSLAAKMIEFLEMAPEEKRDQANRAYSHLLEHFLIDDQVKLLSNAFEECR
ncbi:glycosyltransferase family 4 protein [Marinomonas balearica]|uniref:Glycosyltransferase involved in cell wall biosynthesis n=1 Tax=Marinomonas balearica TaxID=491947 RepID=A0A4R6MH50_9GAMM|nr:glycosyltransferase family 4 protein [Marinomonas balearica]TDP01064.1 glycosyltransferase involved in cell wall biosynthesis [Marinomonas balearica]